MLSKFKKWLNFDRLRMGTADEWHEWEQEFIKQAPIRYWITRKLPYLTWYPVKWKYEAVQDWLRYRVNRRYHIVDTGLNPGYYDTDTLILHTNFNLLKKFVEVEKASMYRFCHESGEEAQSSLNKLLGRRRVINPLNGIKYLEWEATLDTDEQEPNPHQAAVAREVIELYTWWVFDRPAREELESPPEPECDNNRSFMHRMTDAYRKKHPEYYADFQQWCKDHREQEERWEEEDTEMLIRLVKIRKSLWT